ncbi:uncharacterized protein HMPREF1541_08522 [Cyphellophora europaea CBS 101466]|uniref:Pre-mRNA splicing factor CLF1 n=1 Tax=Cyphellophora europaea (strain CBS 101466) TaxID=1220924 RepID=W2RIS8_CYPE1|nr:uncharacterized protein HMPREF1541_08522 [Cyphellophora europaea CBS 101466]ETN36245.1 hypothetical protein HMPREF1541_08522 [Cyphellophora europaea CBS 101466]
MPAPAPKVPLKNQCSVIFDDVLYIYSPDAFQSIELKEDAKWEEHTNGVSVTGAACVLGGVDGDNRKRALYVVGGTANSTNADYPGIQRFSFDDKSWTTIEPVVQVTRDRVRHGANYIPTSNVIVVYGGTSVKGYEGLSSETFMIELEEPYNVRAFDSTAPPASRPFVMPWGDDSVVMVGGSDTNTKIFTFTAGGGWVDFGLELPSPLPDASVAQAAMYTLNDGSKLLQTFALGQEPIQVSTNVLLNPGAVPGAFGQTVGNPTTPASSRASAPSQGAVGKRQLLDTYPAYNSSSIPETTRTDFSIAQGSDGLVAFVGGDEDSSVTFFNQADNSWVSAQAVLGDAPQEPLQPSTTSSTATSTSSPTSPATDTAAASTGSDGNNNRNTFEILGGVLGGLCGLVAILIIFLLYLRNKKRAQKRAAHKSYPAGKKASTDFDFEDGMHPLREHGQPMGRSPVNSTIIAPTAERSSTAMFTARPNDTLTRRISSDNRLQPNAPRTDHGSYSVFAREKSPLAGGGKSSLAISKPMNPNLGDYKERPSIDLGRATPASPVNATPLATIPTRNKSQRKTDEAWGRYFSGGRVDPTADYPSLTPATATAAGTMAARPTTSRGRGGSGGGGFWPGSGAVPTPKSPKFAFRDSVGNTLQTRSVGTATPEMENGPSYLNVAQAKAGRISNANSFSSDGSDYEDEEVLEADRDAFSSGVPASVRDDSPWTPVGNTWSGPAQRPLRSFSKGKNDLPPTWPTAPALTPGTDSSGGTSQRTGSSGGIPNFPMPGSGAARPMISEVQHPAATHGRSASRGQQDGYFPPAGGHRRGPSVNTDVSWLNLGAGGRGNGNGR